MRTSRGKQGTRRDLESRGSQAPSNLRPSANHPLWGLCLSKNGGPARQVGGRADILELTVATLSRKYTAFLLLLMLLAAGWRGDAKGSYFLLVLLDRSFVASSDGDAFSGGEAQLRLPQRRRPWTLARRPIFCFERVLLLYVHRKGRTVAAAAVTDRPPST